MIAYALTFAALCTTYLYMFIQKRKHNATIPPFPGINLVPDPHWLLGHLLMLFSDGNFRLGFQKIFVRDAGSQDGLASFFVSDLPAVSMLLAKDARTVLNVTSFRQAPRLLEFHHDQFLGRKALTTLVGQEWKFYRSAVHRMFTPMAVKNMRCFFNEVGNTLSSSLQTAIKSKNNGETGGDGDDFVKTILPMMKMATMDVFGQSALGVDFQCCKNLQPHKLASAFDFLTDDYARRMNKPSLSSIFYSIPTELNRRHSKERKLVRSFIKDLMEKEMASVNAEKNGTTTATTNTNTNGDGGKGKKKNLLRILLDSREKTSSELEKMSDEGLSDTLMTLLFGGYDTTSVTLTYALYLLSEHPEVEKNCLEEIRYVVGAAGSGSSSGKNDDDDDLIDPAALPYTNAVIRETLRLYPPAPITVRELEKPLELQGKVLPADTIMWIPIWCIHRDERNFPQPEDFLPSRWAEHNDEGIWIERNPSSSSTSSSSSEKKSEADPIIPPGDRNALFAFSGGARNCVGKNLAMEEAVTLLAILLRDLKFERLADYSIEPKMTFLQKPSDDVPMKITCRA